MKIHCSHTKKYHVKSWYNEAKSHETNRWNVHFIFNFKINHTYVHWIMSITTRKKEKIVMKSNFHEVDNQNARSSTKKREKWRKIWWKLKNCWRGWRVTNQWTHSTWRQEKYKHEWPLQHLMQRRSKRLMKHLWRFSCAKIRNHY